MFPYCYINYNLTSETEKCIDCLTFINANSINVKFDNCKEIYWTQIGTNVNLWVLIANLITAIANGLGKIDYCLTIKYVFYNCK